jgi:hypothetical protein
MYLRRKAASMTVEIERDRWGRPLIPPADGEGPARGYTRVTTISEVQGDRYNIEKWLQRQTVFGMALDPTLVTFAQRATDNKTKANKTLLDGIVEDAHKAAKSSQRADEGTSLHDILYRVQRGVPVEIPARWKRHVEEWRRVTADWTFVNTEQMVISDTHMYAGTPDVVAVVPAIGVLPVIVDYKTGASISLGFREMMAQLAMYAHGEWLYEHADGLGRQPMPEVSLTAGLIVHLDADGGGAIRLHKLDLAEGWKAARRSMTIRDWQKVKMADVTEIIEVGEPVEQWLRRRIMRLSAIPEAIPYLVDAMHAKYGNLSTGLDLAHEQAISDALDKLEDAFQLPFPERHPTRPKGQRKKKTS